MHAYIYVYAGVLFVCMCALTCVPAFVCIYVYVDECERMKIFPIDTKKKNCLHRRLKSLNTKNLGEVYQNAYISREKEASLNRHVYGYIEKVQII